MHRRILHGAGFLFFAAIGLYVAYSPNQMQDEALTNFIKQCESEHEQPNTCQTLAATHGKNLASRADI